jgi:hypothetical protein
VAIVLEQAAQATWCNAILIYFSGTSYGVPENSESAGVMSANFAILNSSQAGKDI